MRILLRPSKVKRADFAFFATPDYRAKSVAFKPRHQGEWNTGPEAGAPSGDSPRCSCSAVSAEQNSAEPTLWKSVFLEHGDLAPI